MNSFVRSDGECLWLSFWLLSYLLVYSNNIFVFASFWYFTFFSKNLTISSSVSLYLSIVIQAVFLLLPLLLQFPKRFLYFLSSFALGASPAHNHFYFTFEGSWLHTECKLVFLTSMRIDSWLKFSQKPVFCPLYQSSSFIVWWAYFFLASFLPMCSNLKILALFPWGLNYKYPLHISLVFCPFLVVIQSPSVTDTANHLGHWSVSWLSTLVF